MALHKKNIAEQLERFRKMPGTRIERMRILKEIRVSQGERVTLDQIDVELRHAKQYDIEGKIVIIKELLDGGESLNEIVNKMNLRKSTVARLIKQLRPPEPPPEEASLAPEGVSRPKGA
jgi:hypoxanthine-guanine phosphoribosyltransferase